MILKHRDTEVLRFDWVKPFGVKNVEVNSAAERFLPLQFREQACEDVRFADIFFFDNGYSLFSQAISENTQDNEFKDLRKFLARKEPKLYDHWLDIPGGVTDAMVDRLVGLGKFEFNPHPDFVMPDNRLEVIQYFLQNRIAKIIDYRAKADVFVKIGFQGDTIKANKKTSSSPEDLRSMIAATLKLFPTISRQQLSERLEIGPATVARHIKALQDAGELKRVGSRKTGYWQVIEKGNEA